jgi:CheY-like chemotaxis protein
MAKARVLVVEGEAIVAKDLQNVLKTLGYDAPAIALSGEEAINKSEEIHPDLLFMGIVLLLGASNCLHGMPRSVWVMGLF